MRTSLLSGASLACLSLGLLTSIQSNEETNPHARAPRNVSLEVLEDAWLRAPGADWFAKQAELHPDRYAYYEDYLDGEGAWVDSTNVFQFKYDEAEDTYAYWQWVSRKQLTRGRLDFVQFCASCHGFAGDGYGRSGVALRPAPRSFHQSNFKFTKVIAQLPTDAALLRLIKRGLDGTPMYPWDLSDEVLTDIIQYIKYLSPPETGWRDIFAEIGDVVEAGEDPWADKVSEGVKRGESIYHSTANCHACHPAYLSTERMHEVRGDAASVAYRENLSYPVLKESNYEVLGKPIKYFPPDFTWHQLRAGTTPLDLFETIASGIKGTAMPQWKGALPDEDLWALAYYIESLVTEYKDQPTKRAAFMGALRGN